jgi:hypothetical protein
MAERNVMTENDGDEDLGGRHDGRLPIGNDAVPDGLSPPTQPTIHHRVEKSDDEQFEIVEVDGGGKPLNGQQTDQHGDDNLAADDDETELQRQRRQAEPGRYRNKAERRAAQRQARSRVETENAQLKQQIAELAQRVDGIQPHLQRFDASQRQNEINRLEGEIQAQARALGDAEDKVAAAIQKIALGEQGAAEELKIAQRASYKAIAAGQNLTNQKAQFERDTASSADQQGGVDRDTGADRRQQQPQRQQAAPLTPAAKALATDFGERHSWIDPKGGDAASRTALRLDAEVMAEGFNPATQEYWDELEDRLAEVMPHKVGGTSTNGNGRANGNGGTRQAARQQPAPQRRGPMVSGGDGQAPRQGTTRVTIDPGRKAALMEANVIAQDGTVIDKKKFQNIMRGYRDFDAQHGRSQQ